MQVPQVKKTKMELCYKSLKKYLLRTPLLNDASQVNTASLGGPIGG